MISPHCDGEHRTGKVGDAKEQQMGRLRHALPSGTRSLGLAAAKPVLLAAIVLTITACTGWPGLYGSGRHLKDNPFDRAILSGQWGDLSDLASKHLLKRFPIGSSAAELHRYLESIGGSCAHDPDSPLICRYSQFEFTGNRGFIGDESRSYQYFDFTTRVWPERGPIAKVTICYEDTTEVQRGPRILGGHSYVRKSKFKPCG